MNNSTIQNATAAPQQAGCDFDNNPSHIGGLWFECALTCFHFVFGFFGRLIGLVAIFQNAEKEPAYFYQIILLLGEMIQNLVYSLFIAVNILSGSTGYTKAKWFQASYVGMWYAAKTIFLNNVVMTCTIMLTVAMTCDRVCALIKPTTYRNFNHKRAQKIVLAACIVISVASSLVFNFLLEVSGRNPDSTYAVINTPLALGTEGTSSTAFWVFYHAHSALKIASGIILFAGNFVLTFAFRRAMQEKAKMVKDSTNKTSHQWKTLFKMTICQSIFTTFEVSMYVSFKIYASIVTRPLVPCSATLASDIINEMVDVFELCAMLAFSGAFRRMVVGVLRKMLMNPFRCWFSCGIGHQSSTSVQPIGS